MKRDYRFSSIFWIMVIVGITNLLIFQLIQAINEDSFILNFLADLITALISFVFVFSISGGLIRNRMGSIGDYLNQVNYINMKVITVGLIIAVVKSIIRFLVNSTGIVGIFSAMVSPKNNSVFAIGAVLIPIIGFIILAVVATFFAYSKFYLADNYDTEDGVMTIIGKIFNQGKRLFKKTLVLGLKLIGLPLLIYVLCIGLLFFIKDDMVGMGLLTFFTIAYLIVAVIMAFIFVARLSDIYLDDKEGILE
ncbi:hypothetical protein [uncultured Anaerococcus sp.]|uniref:hypothetical protein n=1 Tax=uncultured Anaerococcus sp. TaxID=293428 RepID=UPI0025E297D7|nr:hypothetical protein [uncultured Anaerococcus sp.]